MGELAKRTEYIVPKIVKGIAGYKKTIAGYNRHAIECGKLLIVARANFVNEDEFGCWIEANLECDSQQAQEYMEMAAADNCRERKKLPWVN